MKQAPTIPLKSVKTFARTMFHALRLVSAVKALVCPADTRSATSAELRPTTSRAVRSPPVACSMRSL